MGAARADVNRSGASVDASQIAQAYALAVGVSCSIAVGAGKLVASGPPWVKRLGIAVPYAAVVSAGAANVAFTRMPEMQSGVPITAPDGTQLGESKVRRRARIDGTQSRAPMESPPIESPQWRAPNGEESPQPGAPNESLK